MSQVSAEFSLDKFLAYSDRLANNLDAWPGVVGLVFLGSAADTSRADEWSDHDFFVISAVGAAEGLRKNLEWLPNFESISIAVRETDHGLKVVYEDGQVLEFAVFEDPELEIASANAFAVAVDKCNLQQRMQAIADKTAKPKPLTPPQDGDLKRDFELFLCQLLIGVGRARRGEVLIAGEHVRGWAVNNLLGLVQRTQPVAPGAETLIDNLSRYRRFEKQYPNAAGQIIEAQAQTVELAARQLLEIAVETCKPYLQEAHLRQVTVVRSRLGWIQ